MKLILNVLFYIAKKTPAFPGAFLVFQNGSAFADNYF